MAKFIPLPNSVVLKTCLNSIFRYLLLGCYPSQKLPPKKWCKMPNKMIFSGRLAPLLIK